MKKLLQQAIAFLEEEREIAFELYETEIRNCVLSSCELTLSQGIERLSVKINCLRSALGKF